MNKQILLWIVLQQISTMKLFNVNFEKMVAMSMILANF